MLSEKSKLRFAVIGCGFWSQFQIAAWHELEGVELVAVYNRSVEKACDTALKFGVPHYYDKIEELFRNEQLDFVDIITDVDTHAQFINMALEHNVAVICQKPLTADFKTAETLVAKAIKRNIPFFVHENFRWQLPIRKLKIAIDSGVIGNVFKARVSFCSAFPVFDNQPFLATLDQFILTDIGSHIFDIVRYLFGDAENIYCKTKTVNKKIKGEDVANAFLEMQNGIHCYAEMSYASILEKEVFPQTLVLVEGEQGSIELAPGFELKITTRHGSTSSVIQPEMYNWVDPDYAVVHSCIVDINRNFRDALLNGYDAETSAADNLKTLQLVFAAYQSAAEGKAISVNTNFVYEH
ncbi:Gfo/Idh/MocA family oxidoreductase [Mucilaginibacter limnophilus]|uniref:Gfo/Idh/MocA family oxidoreductase n=1 Tax=Mucilaginibacter limnophilus TaxID=1932778 RepID=A0A3S2URJ5_9SPHI|nr:Gfo/Idh/MocA family oxidoreductase [Mucilaginibacter limnophilus]RVU02911.1 Gfo/Idh/MocA family oxidoreductase [Mucilaginibacter limnophilus]